MEAVTVKKPGPPSIPKKIFSKKALLTKNVPPSVTLKAAEGNDALASAKPSLPDTHVTKTALNTFVGQPEAAKTLVVSGKGAYEKAGVLSQNEVSGTEIPKDKSGLPQGATRKTQAVAPKLSLRPEESVLTQESAISTLGKLDRVGSKSESTHVNIPVSQKQHPEPLGSAKKVVLKIPLPPGAKIGGPKHREVPDKHAPDPQEPGVKVAAKVEVADLSQHPSDNTALKKAQQQSPLLLKKKELTSSKSSALASPKQPPVSEVATSLASDSSVTPINVGVAYDVTAEITRVGDFDNRTAPKSTAIVTGVLQSLNYSQDISSGERLLPNVPKKHYIPTNYLTSTFQQQRSQPEDNRSHDAVGCFIRSVPSSPPALVDDFTPSPSIPRKPRRSSGVTAPTRESYGDEKSASFPSPRLPLHDSQFQSTLVPAWPTTHVPHVCFAPNPMLYGVHPPVVYPQLQVQPPSIQPAAACPTCGVNPALMLHSAYSQYQLPLDSGACVSHTRERSFERVPRSRFHHRLHEEELRNRVIYKEQRPEKLEPRLREPYGPHDVGHKIGHSVWRSLEKQANAARSSAAFLSRRDGEEAAEEPDVASDVSSCPPTARHYNFGPSYRNTAPWAPEYSSERDRKCHATRYRKVRELSVRTTPPAVRGGRQMRQNRRHIYEGGLTTYRRNPYRSMADMAFYYSQLEAEDQADVISLLLSCRKLEKQIEEQHVLIDMLDHDLLQAQQTLKFPPEWKKFKDLELPGLPPAASTKIPDGTLPLYLRGRVLLQQSKGPAPGATYILEPDMAYAIQMAKTPDVETNAAAKKTSDVTSLVKKPVAENVAGVHKKLAPPAFLPSRSPVVKSSLPPKGTPKDAASAVATVKKVEAIKQKMPPAIKQEAPKIEIKTVAPPPSPAETLGMPKSLVAKPVSSANVQQTMEQTPKGSLAPKVKESTSAFAPGASFERKKPPAFSKQAMPPLKKQ